MRISDRILNKDNIELFIEYYNDRNSRFKSTISYELIFELSKNILCNEYVFNNPTLAHINKISSNKKREIYFFDYEEQLFLKYLNFTLSFYELNINKNCYSFQRGKSIKNSFTKILLDKNLNNKYCLRYDITNYFNSINIEKMMQRIPKCIKEDERIFTIIVQILKNPYVIFDNEIKYINQKGVMAGMPLAPTLANIYLNEFDILFENEGVNYSRYSDDIVIFCEENRVEKIDLLVKEKIKENNLQLNFDKVKVIPPGEKWEFLGLSYENGIIDLSDVSMKKIKGKISRSARKLYRWKINKNADLDRTLRAFIRKFNRKFYGDNVDATEFFWSKWYFPIINTSMSLKEIDHYFQNYCRYLASGTFSKQNYKRVNYKILKSNGYKSLVNTYYNWVKEYE